MVLPLGTFINSGAVILGGFLGMLMGNKLPDGVKTLVFQSLGLCTLVIGMSMAIETSNPLFLVGSILIGGIIGESLSLENRLNNSAERLKMILNSKNQLFSEGLVAGTVLFCIGSMAILGPLEEGLGGPRTIILTKTLLDFFAAIALGAALGSGVIFSFIPILIYQGSITLFASSIKDYLTPLMHTELAATGGVLIIGIGINLLDIKKIRLTNLLPALLIIIAICILAPAFTQ